MEDVEPRLVIAEIMRRKGFTASSLAAAIGKPALQSTISRYLNGHTKDPRFAWVVPAAHVLGIDSAAFRSSLAAAQHRDVPAGSFEPLKVPPRVATNQKRIDPGDLAIQLDQLLRAYSPAVRRAAAEMFFAAAHGNPDPSRTSSQYIGDIARRLRALLADEP